MAIEIVRRKIFENLPTDLARNFARHMKTQDFDEYWHIHGLLEPDTLHHIETRISDPKKPCMFLDLGAGFGNGVLHASKMDNVSSWGLSLHPPEHEELNKHWIRGHIEEIVIPDTFDVIQSRYGLHHAVNIVGLENTLNSLKENGVLNIEFREVAGDGTPDALKLYLDDYTTATKERKKELEETVPALAIRRVFKTLRRQGFTVPSMNRTRKITDIFERVPLFPNEVPIIRGKQRADLREYYEMNGLNRIPIPTHHILDAPMIREKMKE
ncbi:class I SAM-dependent methyltransferase [Candidatus Micrarchaeota archaeon]|nr:class I SAM-dependent methyltransferase [Candidatus Micrarchaeota archaeon]